MSKVRLCLYCGIPMTNPRRKQCGAPECKRLHKNAWQVEFFARAKQQAKQQTGAKPDKRCTKCKILKASTEFRLDPGRKDGLYPHCKQCLQEYDKTRTKGFCEVTWHPCRYCDTLIPNPRRVQCGSEACKARWRADHIAQTVSKLREIREQTGKWPSTAYRHHRECPECGAAWESVNPKAKFCSNTCQAAYEHGPDRRPKSRRARRLLAAAARLAKAARGTRGRRVFIAGWCAKCGTAIITARRANSADMFFCSDLCRRLERAFARRAGHGQINRQAIYRRDGFRCRIPQCLFNDRRVAKSQKAPHPKAPVLDHIIPIGEARRLGMTPEEINAPANLRCAHFTCNSSRRDLGGDDQLALTG